MELHDIEHFSRMVAGCESVSEHLDCNVGMSEEGRYTYAVLQLHAQDEGLVEGTEGFMDSIKKGAQSAAKWIRAIIQAIKDYIRGVSRADRKEIEEIKKKLSEITWDLIDFTTDSETNKGKLEDLGDKLKAVESMQGAGEPSVKRAQGFVDKALSGLGKIELGELFLITIELKHELEKVGEDYTKFVEKQLSGVKDEDNVPNETKGATKAAQLVTSTLETLIRFQDSLSVQVNSVYKKWQVQYELKRMDSDALKNRKKELEKE